MPLNLGTAPTARDNHPTPAPTDPFRLAVLGDFSGRNGDFGTKPVTVNLEDFEATMAKLNPTITLDGLPGDPTLTVASLDDFEPDAVVRAVDHFSDLSDEDEKAAFLRDVLRHPKFRQLEAAWRGVDWLARRGRKGGRQVDLVLYDVSADNFAAALQDDNLADGPAYKALVEDAVFGKKGKPWAAVVALYDYEFTAAHAELLGRAARTLTDCGGPLLAGVSPAATDPATAVDEADAEAWTELRGLPEAGLIGLAAPRFLLRRPYGEDYRPPEAFSFEEFQRDEPNESYLWAPAALVPAGVLAQGYTADGWGAKAQATRVLEGMTTHAYTDADDDDHLTVLDRWLDRKAAERLTNLGVMTTLAQKGRDACELTRLLPLAAGSPPPDLYGRWGKAASAGPPRNRFGVKTVMDAGQMSAAVPAAAAAAAASDGGDSSSSSDSFGSSSDSFGSTDTSSSDTSSSDAFGSTDFGSSSSDAFGSTDTGSSDSSPPADDMAALLASLDTPGDPPPGDPPPDAPPAGDGEKSLEDMMKELGL